MGAVLMAHDAKRIRVALFYPCDKAIYDGGDDPHSSSPSTSGPRPASISAIRDRSEEHTSELQSLMRISYAVFCLKKQKNKQTQNNNYPLLNNTCNNKQRR